MLATWLGITAGAVLAVGSPADPPADPSASADSLAAGPLDPRLERLLAEDTALRALRDQLPQCAEICLTPVEAVITAFALGPAHRLKGRFILDAKGGGADDPDERERLFYLNSHGDFRRYGTLVIAFEAEAMRRLLNPVSKRLPAPLDEGEIIVERRRAVRRVPLNEATMMKRFGDRRLLVDGEVGLKWIGFVGTPGREGARGEGYYQVWLRVSTPDQVTVLDEAQTGQAAGSRALSGDG